MRIAITAAEFSPADADGLRRSMATFRHMGNVGDYETKFIEGMTRRGYDAEFIQRCFKQIEGFGSYGFPESHAISFALLVYASAWVKRRRPDVFCVSLLNSQPMGFYQPAQLVRDAVNHGVEVRPPDVMFSDWDCTLEDDLAPRGPETFPGAIKPVRLGLRQIKGLKKPDAEAIVTARAAGADTIEAFIQTSGLHRRPLELLAEADAFRSLGLSRREALWAVKGAALEAASSLLAGQSTKEAQVALPFMSLPQEVAEDYRTTHLSLKAHPVGFFRAQLADMKVLPAQALTRLANGRRASVGGLVLVRQRPGTAKGVVFLTLEDETGNANIVIWKDAFDANRRTVMSASFLVVHGKVQTAEGVTHLVAERFTDLSADLARLREDEVAPEVRNRVTGRLIRSRDFH